MGAKKKTSKRNKSTKRSSKKTTNSPKNSSNKKEQEKFYIFDANFFICLKQIKANNPLIHLKNVRDELGINFLISDMVYNEIPFMKGARSKKFQDAIDIKPTNEKDLENVKFDLLDVGIKENMHAQDPDLSLVTLARKYTKVKPDAKIYLVSDDFKLSENLKALNYPVEFLSLSAFLLYLSRKTKDNKENAYFKTIRDGALKYTLSYMLERHKQYNAQNKLMWLIEKAVSVADDGGFDVRGIGSIKTTPKEKKFKAVCVDDINEEDKASEKLHAICTKYIQTKDVPFDELDKIVLMLPLLDEIIRGRKYISVAKKALQEDETNNAVRSLRSARNALMYTLQKAGSLLPLEKYLVFQKVVCTELSNCEFLRGILFIGVDDINSALESLNATAMYSTMARITSSVLAINYLKALIFIFNQMYEDAVEQYQFTSSLAINYAASDLLILKCNIGRAITLFLSGMGDEALGIIDTINKDTQKSGLENAMIVFQELGDYFYAISNPKIAISLYREALECAVDSKELKWKTSSILSKMKRAYMNAMLDQNEANNNINIDSLIDSAHELKNYDDFNEAISELSKFNALLYSGVFQFSAKGKKINYYDLEDELKDSYDVVDILESNDTTVLIAFNENVGLVGFRLKLPHKLSGIPENYTLKLKKNANVKILKPSDKLRAKYLLRGIVVVPFEEIDVDRQIPIFFQQMNI